MTRSASKCGISGDKDRERPVVLFRFSAVEKIDLDLGDIVCNSVSWMVGRLYTRHPLLDETTSASSIKETRGDLSTERYWTPIF